MKPASNKSKSKTPKPQLKHSIKHVIEVVDSLDQQDPDPVVERLKNPSPGNNFVEQDALRKAYYVSQCPYTDVPEQPYPVFRWLKDNRKNFANLCGFEHVPGKDTIRKRFDLLSDDLGNLTAIRLFKINKLLEKEGGKKVLPVITLHRFPRQRQNADNRSNHAYRKGRIDNALDIFAMFNLAGTEELADRFCIDARWPDGKVRCPQLGCGSDHVIEVPDEGSLRTWLCLECEEPFNVRTATVFESSPRGLRIFLWTAYLTMVIPFGLPSFVLCLLFRKENGRRLWPKDALDITRRVQTAFIEPRQRLPKYAQADHSQMGYANGVRIQVLAAVQPEIGRVEAGVVIGEVTKAIAGEFFDSTIEEDGEVRKDSYKGYPDDVRTPRTINHAMHEFNVDGITTNSAENFWSWIQEFLYRRRAVSLKYLPLYLSERRWCYNHRNEPMLERLAKFVRNAHDVVTRGDNVLSAEMGVEEETAIQLALEMKADKQKEKARLQEIAQKAIRKARRVAKKVKKGEEAQSRLPGI